MCVIRNKNKRNLTIDLRAIIANDYLQSKKTKFQKWKDTILKYVAWVGIILYLMLSFGTWSGNISIWKANASEGQNLAFLAHFPEKSTVIWCYNSWTKEIREAKRCTRWGDHNIILPPQSQIKIWLKYFNEFEIINRLALVNFESSFNPNAGNYFAKWYVQTLRKYKISPDIDSQLQWLKNRQKYQKVKFTKNWSKRCWYYWSNNNYKDWFEAWEYWVLSCLYRYHYHSKKGTWYSKRGIKTTKFYKEYIFWIKD